MFKYEMHMHTSISSACGKSKGSEYLPLYRDMGYDGVFITDHFYLGNTCVPRDLPWQDWVHRYCDSYREAKDAGEKLGMKVFFGWETSYKGEDFLVYGLDENWLLEHPDLIHWNQKEQYDHIHAAGGLVVQAHPFRERYYQTDVKLHPLHSDAWEVANCGNEAYQDALAYRYAVDHGFKMTSGADIHKVEDAPAAQDFAMLLEKPLMCEQDYVKLILDGTGFQASWPKERMEDHQNPYFETFLFDEKNDCEDIAYAPWAGAPKARKPE